ncbi:MAG: hypothetical protein V1843_00910 [bacterium]
MGKSILRIKYLNKTNTIRSIALLGITLSLACFTAISADARGKDDAPKFVPAQVTVPIGETKTIKLKYQADQNFSIGGYDDSIISVIVDKAEREITISGLKTGETILIAVNDKGIFAAARVVVRKLAGNAPYTLNTVVTGSPAQKKTIFYAAVKNIKNSISLEPNSTVNIYDEKIEAPPSLGQGETTTIFVPVEISGPGYITVKRKVEVEVYNQPVDMQEDEKLLLSNNPETVDRAGILFDGTIEKGSSIRCMYYHQNVSVKPLNFMVTLFNHSEEPSKICVIYGIAKPRPDGLLAGHLSTKMFFDNLQSSNGVIFTIPPQSYFTVHEQNVTNKEVATALFKIIQLEGEDLDLQVRTQTDVAQNLHALPNIGAANHNFQVSGTFLKPNVDINQSYDIKDNYVSIDIGQAPPFKNAEKGEVLKGNYGILYRIKFTLVNNSTDVIEPVGLYYSSDGGIMRGVFLINNELVETKLIDGHTKTEEQIYSIIMHPGEKKEISMTTMPQAGSFYPTKVIAWGSGKDFNSEGYIPDISNIGQ